MRLRGRAERSSLTGVALERNARVFEQVMAAMDQVERQLNAQVRQLEAASRSLSELLEETRAQSQAIFILIDRLPPP